jgi:excisionase family DNA binding protein
MSTHDPAQSAPAEQLWDANDVARYLKVSRSWVYHRAESGELPSFRVGGLRRFDPEAIRSFARGEATRSARVVPFKRK